MISLSVWLLPSSSFLGIFLTPNLGKNTPGRKVLLIINACRLCQNGSPVSTGTLQWSSAAGKLAEELNPTLLLPENSQGRDLARERTGKARGEHGGRCVFLILQSVMMHVLRKVGCVSSSALRPLWFLLLPCLPI